MNFLVSSNSSFGKLFIFSAGLLSYGIIYQSVSKYKTLQTIGYQFNKNRPLASDFRSPEQQKTSVTSAEPKDFNKIYINYPYSIGEKSTTELAHLVLSNCRVTQFFERQDFNASNDTVDNHELFKRTEKLAGDIRHPKRRYRFDPRDKKAYSFCLNTKSGSTFLTRSLLKRGSKATVKEATGHINAFIVIREPMHRMLSAFLNKLRECQPKICSAWRGFAKNIALYVKNSHKTASKLYEIPMQGVKTIDVGFQDFVDYIIHMFLRNNGKIRDASPDKPVPDWVWWHWESVVAESCQVCSSNWRDVVLFENLQQHLEQVLPKYPIVFKNETTLPEIKSSDTNAKVIQYFSQLTDSQIWFLGNVMYTLDYAILPYDWNGFLMSIGKTHLVNK